MTNTEQIALRIALDTAAEINSAFGLDITPEEIEEVLATVPAPLDECEADSDYNWVM